MQHYDFPTRILDASRNPLVGLFFSSYIGQDGNQEKKESPPQSGGVLKISP
jgi:hypothetical protein